MKRLAVFVCLVAACATAPPAPQPRNPATPQPARSANALTPTSTARTLAAPVIRVGMLSDQSAVTFPRVDGGYYVVTDAGASTLRRGLTVTAPLSGVTTRYAVQVSAISDETSA